MTELEVRKIESTLARETVEREHYLHRKPPVSFAFGLFDNDELVGVVTFGQPASNELLKGVCPSDTSLVIELNRLWVHDRMPRNTESKFVAAAMKMLPPMIVVSYADTKEGHIGYIYRALNFNYAGWTDMERKSARWDYNTPSGKHSRGASRGGWTKADGRTQRVPKVRYWLPTGTKAQRKALTRLCAWPMMDWKADPPPTTHVSLKQQRTNMTQPPQE